MKLLFIFTGGTIGSTVSGDYIAADESVPYELLNVYRKRYGLRYSYDIITPYTELSEQNTGSTISKLIDCVRDAICNNVLSGAPDNDNNNRDIYDGIIVTHGTDTLPYSAAALSYALGNDCIPVCLVSGNYPIADERTNGIDNLHGAIRLMEDAVRDYGGVQGSLDDVADKTKENRSGNASDRRHGTPLRQPGNPQHRGVFVSYRNHDGVTYIHRASRLLETQAFSDEYYSVRNEYYGRIENDIFRINADYKEHADMLEPIGSVELNDVCEGILRYHLYPGIYYEDVGAGSTAEDNPKARWSSILLEGFHSGTMNTKLAYYQRYYENIHEQGIPVYLTGVTRGISYESTSLYDKLHIQPIYDIAPVSAYMKLWLLMAAGRKWSADILNKPLGGDV